MNRRVRFPGAVAAAALLAGSPGAGAPVPEPLLLTGPSTYDGQPTIAEGAGGEIWTAWVGYADGGDSLFAASVKDGVRSRVETVAAGKSQIVRPTLCRSGKTLWLFWTESGPEPARIVVSARRGGTWRPAKVLTTGGAPAQNQEVAVDGDGRVHVVWQEFRDGGYDIALRTHEKDKWLPARPVTRDAFDDWDPAVVCDSSGNVMVAWSSYRDGDYDVYVRDMTTPGAGERRLSARGPYDLHPWMAAGKDGRVWVAWDQVKIKRHAESGRSTITGANLKKGKRGKEWKGWNAVIKIVGLAGGKVEHIPAPDWKLRPGKRYRLAHCALPKIAVGDDGRLWLAYRALGHPPERREAGQQGGKKGGKKKKWKPKAYWWEVFVQSCDAGGWSGPGKLGRSDGTLEEPAVLASGGEFVVAYQMEHRKRQAQVMWKKELLTAAHDHGHHGDYGRVLGRDGDVFVARLKAGERAGPAAERLVAREPVPDRKTFPRLPREKARHQVAKDGVTYRLLWGDLHKHSNISRCSSGNEPGPDDHYKYSQDVCRYDFLAMTDHSEHTSEYNWWRIQKLADLYHVPDFFSVLYGYEWSAKYPDGHHNVIFSGRPTVILRSNIAGARSVDELWKSLEASGLEALTIPHTLADPGMGTAWKTHDDRYRRVVEIFQSCRGSYEHDGCPRQHVNATQKDGFYHAGLDKGYRMGVICSSDHGWGTAYAAVYAASNSREDVWRAMWDRRSYGSTTYGLIVDFRADGRLMGEEFSSSTPPEIRVYARGTTGLRSVEILSQGKVVHAVGGLDDPIRERETTVEWRPGELRQGTTYYYARVIQQDDEMAWTSPVWVERK